MDGVAPHGSNGSSTIINNVGTGVDSIQLNFNIGDSGDLAGKESLTYGGLVYFKNDVLFDVTTDNAFSADLDGSSGFSETGRWVVQEDDGDLYVSNETFSVGPAVTSSNLTSTTWALLDTSGPDFYQTYGSFGSLSLTNLEAAGVYYEASRTNDNFTGNANGTGFRIREFNAEGTPIPEPASLALLATGGLCLLSRRRRS